eukprot:gene3936-7146_t
MDPQLTSFFELLKSQNLSKESITKILWTQPSLIKYFVFYIMEENVEENIHWISTLLTGTDNPKKVLEQLQKNDGACGKTWGISINFDFKNSLDFGEIAFKCKTCQVDPTCAICYECFVNGNHEGHDFAMIKNSTGAWSKAGFCKNHNQNSETSNPLQYLDDTLIEVATGIFDALVTISTKLILKDGNKTDIIFLLKSLERASSPSRAIKRIITKSLKTYLESEVNTCLDLLMSKHCSLSNDVGNSLVDFYTSLIPDSMFKEYFSILFLKFYPKFIKSQFEGGKRTITSLSIQIFTVPSITKKLFENYKLTETLVDIIDSIREGYTIKNEKGRLIFKVTGSSFYDPLTIFMYDISYICSHKSIAEKLFQSNLFLVEFLKLESYLQESLEISKTMDSDSNDWVSPFHFENTSIFRVTSSLIDSTSDLLTCLKALKEIFSFLSVFFKKQNFKREEYNTSIIKFDHLKDTFTFRIPIHRFLSLNLFSLVKNNGINEIELKKILSNSNLNLIELLEYPLRLQVLKYHIHRRLWPRNNCQIVEQLINYTSLYPISGYNLDIFLIQILTCFSNLNDFYEILVERFRFKDELFLLDPEKSNEIDLTYSLEEDLISFVLMLYNDRIYCGNSNEENSKDYILHELFLKNSTHSQLQKVVPKIFKDSIDIEDMIDSISSKVQKVSKNSNSEYTTKKENWKELNLYYSNYLPRDLQEVEINFKKVFRNEEIKLKYPNEPFKSLKNLKKILSCNTFYSLIFIILFRSLNNKMTSKLLNSTLHSIIYILNTEQQQDIMDEEVKFESMKESEIKSFRNIKFPFKNSLKKNFNIKIISNHSILSLLLDIKKKDDTLNEQKVFIELIIDMIGKHENEQVKEEEIKKENEREKRLREAKEKQKKIENSFLSQMNEIDESMFLSDEEEEGLDDENENNCVFCHSTTSPSGNSHFGFVSHVSKSESVSSTANLNYIESKEGSYNYNDLKNVKNEDIPWKKQKDDNNGIPVDIGEFKELFSNVNKTHGIQLNSCRHICHFDCFHNYYMSLLQKNSFKGDWCLFLEHLEILCPVCGRLANVVFPILEDSKIEDIFLKYCKTKDEEKEKKKRKIQDDYLSCLSNILKKQKMKEIKESKIEEFSLEASIIQLLQRMIYVSEDFQKIEDPTDPSILYTSFIFNISSQEILMRNINLYELPNDIELKNLMKGINHILNFKFQKKKYEQTITLLNCILGNTDSLSFDLKTGYFPFLSTDLFSTFVRLLILKPELFEDFQKISDIFYLAQIIQSIFVIKFRYQKSNQIKLNDIESSILSIYDDDYFSHFKLPKYIQIDDEIQLIKDLSLTFLRRMVLFKSLCFNLSLDGLIQNSFDDLSKFLKFQSFDSIYSNLNNIDSIESKYSISWIDQLKSSSKINLWSINEIIPKYSIPKPFHFVYLPYNYQDLFLKYHFTKCSTCSKKIDHTTICLICGKTLQIGNCKCETKTYLPGKCSSHMILTGHQLFLNVSTSQLILLRDGRTTILNSPYKDYHGEFDHNLKRGKPLFLDQFHYEDYINNVILNNWDQDTLLLRQTTSRYAFQY